MTAAAFLRLQQPLLGRLALQGGELRLPLLLRLVALVVFLLLGSLAFPPASVELGAGLGAGIHEPRSQRPVVSLARRVGLVARDLHEALVQGEVVADGVLPAAAVVPVEGKVVHDVVVYLVQCQLLLGRALDRHGDEGDVGEWRPLVHLHELLRAVADDSSQQGEGERAGGVDGCQQRGTDWRSGSGGCSLEHLQTGWEPRQVGTDCKLHLHREKRLPR